MKWNALVLFLNSQTFGPSALRVNWGKICNSDMVKGGRHQRCVFPVYAVFSKEMIGFHDFSTVPGFYKGSLVLRWFLGFTRVP